MRLFKLAEMLNGWFVGNFTPTALSTSVVEVGVKTYRAGDSDPPHVHRIATELTLVISGEVDMNGRRLVEGDIASLAPGEPSAFTAITDAMVVAVKMPSVAGDKHLIEAVR